MIFIIIVILIAIGASYYLLRSRRKPAAEQTNLALVVESDEEPSITPIKQMSEELSGEQENKVSPLLEDESGRKYRNIPKIRQIPRKSYIYGRIKGKYWGEVDLYKLQEFTHEQFYYFHIYEAIIETQQDGVRRENAGPFHFMEDETFPKDKLPDKVPCIMSIDGDIKGYSIVLHEPRIRKVVFIRKLHQKEDGEIFGTIEADITGYILDFVKQEYIERVYEYESIDAVNSVKQTPHEVISLSPPKRTHTPTGNFRYKGNYRQQEFYYSDYKNRYWSDWQHYRKSEPEFLLSAVGIFGFIIGIIFLLLILPRLVVLLPFIILLFLLVFLSDAIVWIFRGVLGLLILGFVYSVLHSTFVNKRSSSPELSVVRSSESPTTTFTPQPALQDMQSVSDTLITHYFSWKDYNGKRYEGHILVKNREWNRASLYKNQLGNGMNYDYIVYKLKEHDKSNLSSVYSMFDSLRVSHQLDASGFCEMIVSFVQHLPYTLILPEACDPRLYSDMLIKDYLASASAECEGFQRFGIKSPVEFMATLRGDCDTRTLFLYTVLSHYKYDIVMLSSDLYSHSLLGINLPYGGVSYPWQQQEYVLWETTYPMKPGIIPDNISNLNYWRISLKT